MLCGAQYINQLLLTRSEGRRPGLGRSCEVEMLGGWDVKRETGVVNRESLSSQQRRDEVRGPRSAVRFSDSRLTSARPRPPRLPSSVLRPSFQLSAFNPAVGATPSSFQLFPVLNDSRLTTHDSTVPKFQLFSRCRASQFQLFSFLCTLSAFPRPPRLTTHDSQLDRAELPPRPLLTTHYSLFTTTTSSPNTVLMIVL